mmetsp:Transcript_21678/g.42332  ORF Transcript_21678/g.42332 Transcript_21678/m.42332 type:complete len:118 (-) Transcript_21678:180-533(-)
MALAEHLSTVRLEEAHASEQSDKDMIFKLVDSMPGGFDAINQFVRHIISSALRVMKGKFDNDFQVVLNKIEPEDKSGTSLPKLADARLTSKDKGGTTMPKVANAVLANMRLSTGFRL